MPNRRGMHMLSKTRLGTMIALLTLCAIIEQKDHLTTKDLANRHQVHAMQVSRVVLSIPSVMVQLQHVHTTKCRIVPNQQKQLDT